MKKRSLKIVIVTTEIVPYSKVGGLADVMGALPDELEKLGCDVTIITPLYSSIDRRTFHIEPEANVPPGAVTVGERTEPFRVYSATKPGTGITVLFVENENFYGRDGIYTVPDTGEAFEDEDERTIFFNRAVIESIKACDLFPDVIHCNDFHTGLIPAYLVLEEGDDPHFRDTGTVFSVHNLAYQGTFEREFVTKAGFDPALFTPLNPFEYWGKVNVMKIGLSYAGLISTVSETYAEEIMSSEEYGYGMEGILRSRRNDVIGILNGIDLAAWDPSTDRLLPFTFSLDDLAGKAKNRTALLEEYNLPARGGVPVIGMVSRLVDQKGFDILSEAFDRLMKLDLYLVILGTGQQEYHDSYTKLAARYPERFGLKLEFNNGLAHLIEAGSDFFLMPSRYEPCGLNQMYSLRYGTIPIVRATGGLKDTITDLTPKGGRGNGFTFDEYEPEALASTVERAVSFYRSNGVVDKVRKRIMREDHSWMRSAKDYMKLYRRAHGTVGVGV
ncbi:MAG TPA: glycogen synthase [Patescibacteria group bacterium]|nr:glycogen synthase [Patescibacteria group bacterium]